MKERVNRLARGLVEYGSCELSLSVDRIEMAVTAGRKDTGEFRITSGEATLIKGLLYSTDRRVKPVNDRFSGSDCILYYEVDASHELPGTEISGEFQLVSSCGERSLPYFIRIKNSAEDQMGPVDTPEAFAALARENRDLALRLFDSAEFLQLPFLKNEQYRTLYEGLSARGNKRNAMEEFLAGSGLKERIWLTVEESERRYTLPQLPDRDSIRLEKSTWGYVRVEVDTDCPFLELDKTVLSEEDFAENVCELRYHLDETAVHGGVNLGSILLKTPLQSFRIPITVRQAGAASPVPAQVRREWISYLNLYLELLAGGREELLLLNGMQAALSYIRGNSECPDLVELLHAEVYLLLNKREQAGLLLEDVQGRLALMETVDTDTECYYLYVKALASGRQTDRDALVEKLNRYMEYAPTATDLVMLLLLRVESSLRENPSLRLSQIKNQYRRGCRSPFLYLEACKILNSSPELLRVMDSFELQTLNFGVRREMLSLPLALRIASLALQEKGFRPLYYRVLAGLCEKYENRELLSGLCVLLMRGDCRGERWFSWYQKGVEQDIRLTRLYEYYLYSLPADFTGELSRIVLLYFSYNNTLDHMAQARLYRYILDHEGEGEPYEQVYRHRIEEFAREQMLEGHISPELSVIYSRLFRPELIDEKMARMLPKLLYANCISCDNPQMRYAVICNSELKNETVVPLRGGRAYLPLYLDNPRLLVQDAFGNRYEGVSVTRSFLMDAPEMKEKCLSFYPDHGMLRLSAGIRALREKDEDGLWVEKLRRIKDAEELHPRFREQLISELLRYYRGHLLENGTAEFLLSLQPSSVTMADRGLLIALLVELDFFREAYAILEETGSEEICRRGYCPVHSLLRLCSRMILERNFEKDEGLLSLAFSCLGGERADAVVAEYLCQHYNGSSSDMFRILQSARELRAETFDMEERLLGQMLFSGSCERLDETFQAYAAKAVCDETLVNAYLVVKSYRYFLGQDEIGEELITYMKRRLRERNDVSFLPRICLMALTRYDSQQERLAPEDCELCQKMIDELYRKNYVFAYYRDCARFIRLPESLGDKVIIEYRGEKAGRIQIRTRILPGGQLAAPQTMPHMYEGIFVLLATVFYGETLEYEITDLNRDGELVEKASLCYRTQERFGRQSRIGMLNRILEDMEGNDAMSLKKSLIDYGTAEALIEEIFQPI